MVAPISDFIVTLGLGGCILSQDTMPDNDKEGNKEEVVIEEEVGPSNEQFNIQRKAAGKLVLEEDVAEGHISMASGT